jgi:hypothetical protein
LEPAMIFGENQKVHLKFGFSNHCNDNA